MGEAALARRAWWPIQNDERKTDKGKGSRRFLGFASE
jgi:hypothetical protein